MSSIHELHVITDGARDETELLNAVRSIAGQGATSIQLRYKAAAALDIYHLARAIQPVLQAANVRLLINDRVDVAQAIGASGCHLAGRSLPPEEVRRLLGPSGIIGSSVHAVDEAVRAEQAGANYVTFGHVFPSSSKPGLTPRGTEQLAAVVQAVNIPVLAIGGINPSNVDAVLATGCAGIAVIGAIMSQSDPAFATLALRQALDRSRHSPKAPFSDLYQRSNPTDGGER